AASSADAALVRGGLAGLPHLFRLARRTRRTILFNLSFSMALNFLAVVLAAAGLLGTVAGALVHNAGSVFVIVNSARLLMLRPASPPRPWPGADPATRAATPRGRACR
ncbi:MAG: cation-translocating P-type ATPase, partial [Kiritimatiellae bacterium]|nr:cation-translocating P-type ATPase [Kiritimatiellia bacterium]